MAFCKRDALSLSREDMQDQREMYRQRSNFCGMNLTDVSRPAATCDRDGSDDDNSGQQQANTRADPKGIKHGEKQDQK